MYTIKTITFREFNKSDGTKGKLAKCVFSDDKEVTIWDRFPGFTELKEGSQVSGDLAVGKPYNGVEQWTLNPIAAPSTFKKSGGAGIARAMETKAANIEQAQDRKNDSIKLAAFQRDSVLIVTTFYADAYKLHTVEEMESSIKSKILDWKRWLEHNYGDNIPFK